VLGAYTHPAGIQSKEAQRQLKTGKQLAYTCYQMYARQSSGLSPEYVDFVNGKNDFEKGRNAPYYLLRPEVCETLFIIYHLTKDPVCKSLSVLLVLSLRSNTHNTLRSTRS
jgi:hypothetical protein